TTSPDTEHRRELTSAKYAAHRNLIAARCGARARLGSSSSDPAGRGHAADTATRHPTEMPRAVAGSSIPQSDGQLRPLGVFCGHRPQRYGDLAGTGGYLGFGAGYKSVNRFVGKLGGNASSEACAGIETAPGEELQVDYGTGPMVRDPYRGKYRRTRLFVLTLGYRRKSVRLVVFRSSAQIWAELHGKACRRLGGCTRVVVLDNLREGVLTADIYDPSLNPLYRDLLKHYGTVPLPCRFGMRIERGRWSQA